MRSILRGSIAAALCVTSLAMSGSPATASNTLGDVTLYSTPSLATTGPNAIAADADGNAWFTVPTDSKIGRIDKFGTVTWFAAPDLNGGLCVPWQITYGPDDAMWFTCFAGGIGRIDSTGATSVFPLSNSSAAPWSIATGWDGNLWFTEPGIDSIGVMTTSGTYTEWPFGQTGVNLRDITRGPDNSMWFVTMTGPNSGANPYVGKISMTGSMTQFIMTGGQALNGIAYGWDGNLWITHFGAQKIAKISSVDGSVLAEYPTSFANPKAIATGLGGQMWVTEGDGGSGRIGAFTASGIETTYSTGASSTLNGIVAGPGGDMWFTAWDVQKVGKVTTGYDPADDATSIDTSQTFEFGRTIDCTQASWMPNAVGVNIGWQRNGIAIDGAEDLSYEITGADVGTSITCSTTAIWPQLMTPFTSVSNEVVPTGIAPDPPSMVIPSGGVRLAVIRWEAPESDGGSPITGYTVTAVPGGKTCTTTGALTCSMRLPRGNYYFRVYATNDYGDSMTVNSGATSVKSSCRITYRPREDGTVPSVGTTLLFSKLDASKGCRLQVSTASTPLVRGDIRPARFTTDMRAGTVRVTTFGMPETLTVSVRAVAKRNEYVSSPKVTRSWRVR